MSSVVAARLRVVATLCDEAEQFLREARAAGQLRHPGIVAVHEVGREGDRIYIVGDFVQGITMADSISAQRPSVHDAVRLCWQIALALHHAHQHGIIHRDLKPSNIILDDSGLYDPRIPSVKKRRRLTRISGPPFFGRPGGVGYRWG